MSALSNYLENALINHILRGNVGGTAYTQPTQLYLALFTSDPTDEGTGTEVSGGGYQRRPITFSPPNNGSTSNDVDVVFPIATASWGIITHGAIFDAKIGGNMLFHGAFSSAKTIEAGDQYIVRAGNYTISFD